MIDGTHSGAIRAKGGTKVRWTGPENRDFTITVTEFDDNDSRDEPRVAKAFDEEIPPEIKGSFTGTLVKPEKGAATLFFKYTIQIDGCKEADPPIVIEKR